jgi:polyisoprenoid-binding protein YceI
MKKILNYALILIFTFVLASCEKEKKSVEKTTATKSYVIDALKSTVQWTAYKTTDKLPVKGTFKEINILNMNEGSSAPASLEGLEFEIPVSSIFTNDTIRDTKLNTFFFAIMENTLSLKGVFSVENETKGNLALTMNGLTKDLPFSYEMSRDTILINTKMDLNIWQTQAALESLHQACLALHTGPDGVSKTWDEVAISAKILTVQK